MAATVLRSTSSDAPPVVFHSFDRSEPLLVDDKWSVPCPLCKNLRRSLICSDCVRTACFSVGSSVRRDVRFDDLQAKLMECQQKKLELISRVKELLEPLHSRDGVQFDVQQKRQHVMQLTQSIQLKKKKKQKGEEDLTVLRESIDRGLPRQSRVLKEKLAKTSKHLGKLDSAVLERREKLKSLTASLASLRRSYIQSLTRYVFPVERDVPPVPRFRLPAKHRKETEEPATPDYVTDMVLDAASHSFESGHWHYSEEDADDNATVAPYRIVHPRLPATGDYSDLLDEIGCHHKDATTASGTPILSPKLGSHAHELAAGLAYTSQLVNILARFLDVLLPYKITPRRFYNCARHSRASLEAAICCLNRNITYMCCHQRVDISKIHPRYTLSNVAVLLNSVHLGSTGPFTLHTEALQSMEGALSDSDSDNDDAEDAFKDADSAGAAAAAAAGGSALALSDTNSEWDSLCDSDIAASAAHVAAGSPLAASSTSPWSASTVVGSNSGSIMSSVLQWWRGSSNTS